MVVLAILGAAWLHLRQTEDGPVPNALRERFADEAICEIDDVQFALGASPERVTGDRTVWIPIAIQNTLDMPRDVEVHVASFPSTAPGLVHVETARASILGVDAQVLLVPVHVHPDATGPFEVGFDVRVSGQGGRRRLTWQADEFEPPLGRIGTLLNAAAEGAEDLIDQVQTKARTSGSLVHRFVAVAAPAAPVVEPEAPRVVELSAR